jgi:hypothetical protein
MKKVILALASLLMALSLVGTTAFADSPKNTTNGQVLLSEIHSPLEHSGTFTSERKPWSEPGKGYEKPGEVHPDGLGWWWGGYYSESVTNTLLQNNFSRDPAVAFKMLGRGVCMDTTETTSLTGTINISGEAKWNDLIKTSFGFSGSGTKTFTQTYKYCGPSETTLYLYRYFYKQLIYNKYRSDSVRIYYSYNGLFNHIETGSSIELVPYMAVFSEDRNQ